MRYLIIIPARQGSKRLPGKNLRIMNGKPLIAHTLEAALNCGIDAEVCVSSDSQEVLAVAREYGVETPFVRPAELAGDEARSIDVVLHALAFHRARGQQFASVVLLQPTSPLRTASHVRDAVALFEQRRANSVVSVCEVEHPPSWTMQLDSSRSLDGFAGALGARSRDDRRYYRLNGALYISQADVLVSCKSFFSGCRSYAYVMCKDSSVDVDDIIDFRLAEMLMSERDRSSVQS